MADSNEDAVMAPSVMSDKEVRDLISYYKSRDVRKRLDEYCNYSAKKELSCEYLIGFGEPLKRLGYNVPVMGVPAHRLDDLIDMGLDLFRSVWDHEGTLAILDIEYFNLDSLATLYANPVKYFKLLEPTYRAITDVLDGYGITHLNNTTPSGYHFESKIPFSTKAHKKLEKIGHLESSLKSQYASLPESDHKCTRKMTAGAALGYSAIGRLMEFLCHRVIEAAGPSSKLPITIADTAPGENDMRREGVSLDITQYGDNLNMRSIRFAFSGHQKHKVYVNRFGADLARRTPVYACVPRNDHTIKELYDVRKGLDSAREYAATVSARIPKASRGWAKLADDYMASSLFAFHREFDSVNHDPRDRWTKTYLDLDLERMPACVAMPLMNANPWLLMPTNIQTVCRVFYAMGWHPKHIAGMIRAHYSRGPYWPIDWNKYNAEVKANFWVRVYCGMIATGTDSLDDLNCASQAFKWFCPKPFCGHNLADYRAKIESRA